MIRVRLLVGLFFICQLLFSQSTFEGLTDDQKKSLNPGYSAIGRMMGLSEIRGIIKSFEFYNMFC